MSEKVYNLPFTQHEIDIITNALYTALCYTQVSGLAAHKLFTGKVQQAKDEQQRPLLSPPCPMCKTSDSVDLGTSSWVCATCNASFIPDVPVKGENNA